MELAHPLVAAGVAQHSQFEQQPLTRLARTIKMMDAVTFGPPQRSLRAIQAFRSQHERIKGRASDGRRYAASDPELLLWVHATLVDTALAIDRRYLGVLTDSERARYYLENSLVARALGIPKKLVPVDLGSFESYMSVMAGALAVEEDARRIARFILKPSVPGPIRPLGGVTSSAVGLVVEAVTADLLPPRIRAFYGLDSAALTMSKMGLDLASTLTRATAPRIPPPLLRALSAGAIAYLGVPKAVTSRA